MKKNSSGISRLVSAIAGNKMQVSFTPSPYSHLPCNDASTLERKSMIYQGNSPCLHHNSVDWISTKKDLQVCLLGIKPLTYVTLFTVVMQGKDKSKAINMISAF